MTPTKVYDSETNRDKALMIMMGENGKSSK